jgi:NAD(P)H-quinone oxidoreductase subunit 5
MRPLQSVLVASIPLAPALAGAAVRLASRGAAGALAFAGALAAAVLAAAACPGLDPLSAVMAVLVASLGAVVLGFSRRYLAGDRDEPGFHSWMSLALASVLCLVLSRHLLLIVAAWVATSLCLHRLLLHYPERPGAVFAARKKFVFSRLGDACLLAAAILLHRAFGAWELGALFSAAAAGPASALRLPCLLVVACAALKSAQFPFHSWLPDTMETPTPVSAFMHAGIINAGGFLLIRLAPLMARAPAALHVAAVDGALTAAFGAVVMLAQPSVKRSLAYSTVAQMGFMMLECGLGAFGLALLHLAAHSVYKANAFLRSGSTVGAVPRAAVPLRPPALAFGLLGGALVVAALAAVPRVVGDALLPGPDIFSLVLLLALAYGLARAWSGRGGWTLVARSLAAALGVGLATLFLHGAADALRLGGLAVAPPPALLAFVGALFAALFVFQALLWRAGRHALGRSLYVHALNGFYVGAIANRLLLRLWPRAAAA